MSSIVLPVPQMVYATYLVPGETAPDEVARIARSWAPRLFADPLPALVDEQLDGPLISLAVVAADEGPPLPLQLLPYFGTGPEQMAVIESASHFVLVQLVARAGWPPLGDWTARAVATCLAVELGVPLLDMSVPRAFDAEAAARTLPDADRRVRLSDWIQVLYSADSSGMWVTTSGLGRVGLPELQTFNVPPQLAQPWGRAMTGLAGFLSAAWARMLQEDRDASIVELPATVPLTSRHVAIAYATETDRDGTVELRLELDPATQEGAESFLTVLPPLDHPTSSGEFVAQVCAELFGAAEDDIRHVAPSEAMDEAIRTARASLPDARQRFVNGGLPLDQQLMVKYSISRDGSTEYLWAYVTSWSRPETLLATASTDAELDERVRVGRPVVIEADDLVDWALWTDAQGIIEGGWTNAVLSLPHE